MILEPCKVHTINSYKLMSFSTQETVSGYHSPALQTGHLLLSRVDEYLKSLSRKYVKYLIIKHSVAVCNSKYLMSLTQENLDCSFYFYLDYS